MQPGKTDFSFDARVVSLYNRQRAHPPEAAERIGVAIMAAAGSGARLLEMGIGTGRIAWPVVAAGGTVIGFDVAPQMLGQVMSSALTAYSGALHLAQADMHAMPFAADTFDAVLAVHVLHLARDWPQVLREIARVLRADGVFIQGDDWMDPQSVMGKLRDELRRHAVRLDPSLMPPAATAPRGALLAELGGTQIAEQIVAEWTTYISPAERLALIEQRIDAESWILTDALFQPMLAHLRAYAADQWSNLEEPQPVTRRFILKLTRGRW